MGDKVTVNVVYDCDRTLSSKVCQEFGMFKDVNKTNTEVWGDVMAIARKTQADVSFVSFKYTIDVFKNAGLELTRSRFEELGKKVKFFRGVEEHFELLKNFAEKNGVQINNFINSANMLEIIESTKIADNFKQIFGCEYMYDEDGRAIFPKNNITTRTKPDYLYKIAFNKLERSTMGVGNLKKKAEKDCFYNMIYIGDSMGDSKAFEEVTKKKGLAIAVYGDKYGKDRGVEKLVEAGIVKAYLPANYEKDSKLIKLIENQIVLIKKKARLKALVKKLEEFDIKKIDEERQA